MNAKNKELNDIQFDTEELKSRFSAESELLSHVLAFIVL